MPKPKTTTTYRTCPECGSRATKIFSLSAEPGKEIKCQICGHQYASPPPEARRVRRKRRNSFDWWFA